MEIYVSEKYYIYFVICWNWQYHKYIYQNFGFILRHFNKVNESVYGNKVKAHMIIKHKHQIELWNSKTFNKNSREIILIIVSMRLWSPVRNVFLMIYPVWHLRTCIIMKQDIKSTTSVLPNTTSSGLVKFDESWELRLLFHYAFTRNLSSHLPLDLVIMMQGVFHGDPVIDSKWCKHHQSHHLLQAEISWEDSAARIKTEWFKNKRNRIVFVKWICFYAHVCLVLLISMRNVHISTILIWHYHTEIYVKCCV